MYYEASDNLRGSAGFRLEACNNATPWCGIVVLLLFIILSFYYFHLSCEVTDCRKYTGDHIGVVYCEVFLGTRRSPLVAVTSLDKRYYIYVLKLSTAEVGGRNTRTEITTEIMRITSDRSQIIITRTTSDPSEAYKPIFRPAP